jgi:hypothetical protein
MLPGIVGFSTELKQVKWMEIRFYCHVNNYCTVIRKFWTISEQSFQLKHMHSFNFALLQHNCVGNIQCKICSFLTDVMLKSTGN